MRLFIYFSLGCLSGCQSCTRTWNVWGILSGNCFTSGRNICADSRISCSGFYSRRSGFLFDRAKQNSNDLQILPKLSVGLNKKFVCPECCCDSCKLWAFFKTGSGSLCRWGLHHYWKNDAGLYQSSFFYAAHNPLLLNPRLYKPAWQRGFSSSK